MNKKKWIGKKCGKIRGNLKKSRKIESPKKIWKKSKKSWKNPEKFFEAVKFFGMKKISSKWKELWLCKNVKSFPNFSMTFLGHVKFVFWRHLVFKTVMKWIKLNFTYSSNCINHLQNSRKPNLTSYFQVVNSHLKKFVKLYYLFAK